MVWFFAEALLLKRRRQFIAIQSKLSKPFSTRAQQVVFLYTVGIRDKNKRVKKA